MFEQITLRDERVRAAGVVAVLALGVTPDRVGYG